LKLAAAECSDQVGQRDTPAERAEHIAGGDAMSEGGKQLWMRIAILKTGSILFEGSTLMSSIDDLGVLKDLLVGGAGGDRVGVTDDGHTLG
jgi:hypothetical protein